MLPDDDLIAALEPVTELVTRLLRIVETLTARVDVLELERMHRQGPVGHDGVNTAPA